MFLRNITIFLENISIFFGNIKVFLQQESVSKLNRPIPSSAVGAGFACPKTQSQLFSDERTSSPRIKRQHYPRFDTASCATLAAPGKGIKTDKGNLMIGVGDLHTPQSMKEEIIKNNRFKSHSTN